MKTAVSSIACSLLAVSTILGGASLFGEEAEFVPYTGQAGDGNYLISDANGLARLAEVVLNSANGEDEACTVYARSTFRLTDNIDLEGRFILPIGVTEEFAIEGAIRWPARIFAGTFDGCGDTITNYRAAFPTPGANMIAVTPDRASGFLAMLPGRRS